MVTVALASSLWGAGAVGAAASALISHHHLPVGAAVPAGGGVVNFSGYSTKDGPESSAIVTGVIADFGTATRIETSGSTREYTELKLSLDRGSFELDISNLESNLNRAIVGHFPTNTHTCSGEVSASAASTVIKGSGTGTYAGISGALIMTVTINEVETPPRCPKSDTSPLLSQSVYLSGSGRVKVD